MAPAGETRTLDSGGLQREGWRQGVGQETAPCWGERMSAPRAQGKGEVNLCRERWMPPRCPRWCRACYGCRRVYLRWALEKSPGRGTSMPAWIPLRALLSVTQRKQPCVFLTILRQYSPAGGVVSPTRVQLLPPGPLRSPGQAAHPLCVSVFSSGKGGRNTTPWGSGRL